MDETRIQKLIFLLLLALLGYFIPLNFYKGRLSEINMKRYKLLFCANLYKIQLRKYYSEICNSPSYIFDDIHIINKYIKELKSISDTSYDTLYIFNIFEIIANIYRSEEHVLQILNKLDQVHDFIVKLKDKYNIVNTLYEWEKNNE